MQERRNSSALAMELRLSCTSPSLLQFLGPIIIGMLNIDQFSDDLFILGSRDRLLHHPLSLRHIQIFFLHIVFFRTLVRRVIHWCRDGTSLKERNITLKQLGYFLSKVGCFENDGHELIHFSIDCGVITTENVELCFLYLSAVSQHWVRQWF